MVKCLRNRLVFTGIFFALCLVPTIWLWSKFNAAIGWGAFFALAAFYLSKSLYKLPEKPLTKGAVTFLGNPQDVRALGSGWHILPFCQMFDLFGVIPIDATRKILEVTQRLRTPADNAPNEVNPFLEYVFDEDHPVEFLRNNGFEGVNKSLSVVIEERVRGWMRSPIEGPQTWQEAESAGEEAVNVLLRTLFNTIQVPTITSDIPTVILLKYFRNPQGIPTDIEAKQWGKKWEKLEERLGNLAPGGLDALKNEVNSRRRLIIAAMQGQAALAKDELGIKIVRLGFGKIDVAGEFATLADEKARAKIRRDVENVELDNVRRQIKELKPVLDGDAKQAKETVLLVKGKITQTITEEKKTYDPATVKTITDGFVQIVKTIVKKDKSEEAQ